MKNLFLICLTVLACSLQVFSQQKEDIIYHEGDLVRQWFYAAKAKIKEKNITKAYLAHAKPQTIPDNMLEILKQNDWIEAGTYWFKDQSYRSSAENSHQLELVRITKGNQLYSIEARISIDRIVSDKLIDYRHRRDPIISIEKINGRNFLKKSKKEREADSYGQIISYQDGVFIYDVTREGTSNAINSIYRFRHVWIKMPKYDFGPTHPSEQGLSSHTNQNNPTPSFPSYNYPIPPSVPSKSNCSNPMNEVTFYALAEEVFRIPSSSTRLGRLQAVTQTYCMNTSQAMRFASLLDRDNAKLTFLKNAYHACYDVNNFSFSVEVFESIDTKDALMEYIAQQNATNIAAQNDTKPANISDCQTIPNTEFEHILEEISQEMFDKDRLKTANTFLSRYKCFSTQQVKRIAALFPFSNARMEFIESAYPHTYDKQNFYHLEAILHFSHEKEKLKQIINNK